MQENKDASRCTRSVASDARNQSPEQAGKKKNCEKLVEHASDLVEHRMQTGCPQVRPKCRFHVLHGFARIQIWDRVSISSENHDERTVPKVHVLHLSFFVTTSPDCAAECSDPDKKTKSEPRHRGHHDSPPSKQEFVSLQIASFANPAVRTELLSSTNVCGQLRHHRSLCCR